MNKKNFKNSLLKIVCMILLAASVITTTGCSNSNDNKPEAPKQQEESKKQVLGEGKTVFPCFVVDAKGKETEFEIHTDKKTVGEALLEVKLIEGEDSDYGLYVKKVNGILADYDKDKSYWAFYINDQYANTGVDATEIKENETYKLKIEK